MAFEETETELQQNAASLGFDLADLTARQRLNIDYIHIERSEIEETGEYDLEALFVRLAYAIDSVKAKRVVLDTLEALFAGLPNPVILRAELRRLFRWLKERGLTTIITAERGEGSLTRYGLEEYISDCVILLDHRVLDQVLTRRLRIVKYRGSAHGTNEYPFLISDEGVSVLPITSVELHHAVSTDRISTGIPRLDQMLGGQGYYRGSSILVTGTAGTGKTSLAAHFVDAACRRGERCLYLAFEESPQQIIRNMRSIGLNLEPQMKKGLLHIEAARPTAHGLELHLVLMSKIINALRPRIVVIDPITNLVAVGDRLAVSSMLMRLVDYLKSNLITSLFLHLSHTLDFGDTAPAGSSSLADTLIALRAVEQNGRIVRTLQVLKSRGLPHADDVRTFKFTEHGLVLNEDSLARAESGTSPKRSTPVR
jgi:circadian clock protein KaiC